ncbi:membrane protein [Kitasatospora herbaricolor]|uniref:GtrA family protein n=1 Tax=Kitasatospora herbaricolor TaxID=68217 RepID=UPI00174B0A31|nr:GtrA family protein [Kitasatospora herbaricolor]MDQ0308698.1 putative flippase GtrA [Kitasatospora herbaricolor]GGV10705.1 membrane protein [Kitasatospora herbaricolor]
MTTTAPSRPSLSQRLSGISGEVVKFGIVGLVGVVVNFGVSNAVLHLTGWAPVRCSAIGIAVAIATNYLGYRYWVYRDSDAASRRREITLFLIFSGIGMSIEVGTGWFTRYTLGLTGILAFNLSKVVGTGLGTLFRFFSYRTWVFKAIPEIPKPEEVALPRPQLGEPGDLGAEGQAGPVAAGPVPAPAPAPAPAERLAAR